ncbi:4-coumarate--CoA ligase-like 9 [Aristolochia californica]|uniref:4-coumarate--CoA ligase-like 9 n=1 Tax=Aristolochia californica TaxID=171875 RepID=UPI0035DA40FD
MAIAKPTALPPSIDPRCGFCSATKTFHSLRPALDLPHPSLPHSVTSYVFSLLSASSSPRPEHPAFVDSDAGLRVSYSDLLLQTRSLAASLRLLASINRSDVAFVLAPTSVKVPILYLSLLSIGVVVSPANPLATSEEISRHVRLSNPKVVFATSATFSKVYSLGVRLILLDSPEFESMMVTDYAAAGEACMEVKQSDPAGILYSSGTTGGVKGVVLTHRNFMALIAGLYSVRQNRSSPAVVMVTVPLFHMFGFFYCMKAVALAETVVLMHRFEIGKALGAVEEFKVTTMAVAPPVVVALVKADATRHDLSSLEVVASGGAPLGKEVIQVFASKFRNVQIAQGYGLTESAGAAFRTVGPEETRHYGSAGRLSAYTEAKLVDPVTGEALPPCNEGELWIRGSTIMKGYIGDESATSATLDSEGWLRTGDLCYIDTEGFIFVVDRLKELIKFKGFQVAPAELEQLLQSHPEIVDAAVIPFPDEEAGQLPMAFVVKRTDSTLNQTQVMSFVARQVSQYKKIRRVSFINSIPKNPAGKILRKDLIKLAVSGLASKL